MKKPLGSMTNWTNESRFAITLISICGVFVDNEVGIQFVQTEESPTGRGKEDTAILMESDMLLTAQSELLNIQWNAASSYHTAKAKLIDGMMTEPLRLSLGDGSFYERFKESIKMGMDRNSNAVFLTKNGQVIDNELIPNPIHSLHWESTPINYSKTLDLGSVKNYSSNCNT